MTILALEFSSPRRGVAVARDGIVLAETLHEGSPRTPIFALIGKALEDARVNRSEVDCLAVGLGPGSYTGIRLAISVAQGWQLAAGVRTIGVSSMENLSRVAVGQAASLPESDGPRIPPSRLPSGRLAACPTATVLLAVDAQRGEFAVAAQLAAARPEFVPAEQLAPVYLREASFVKAPPPRVVKLRTEE
jgi:tRNA threonylcarbamoyl adenosine modification protein YeaZ